MHGLQL
jgi:hypothetical protein